MNDFSRIKGERRINAPGFVTTTTRSMPKSENHHPVATPKKQNLPQKSNGILDLLNLKNIAMDTDRSLILMMLALLMGKDEETDELLIMALLYIML